MGAGPNQPTPTSTFNPEVFPESSDSSSGAAEVAGGISTFAQVTFSNQNALRVHPDTTAISEPTGGESIPSIPASAVEVTEKKRNRTPLYVGLGVGGLLLVGGGVTYFNADTTTAEQPADSAEPSNTVPVDQSGINTAENTISITTAEAVTETEVTLPNGETRPLAADYKPLPMVGPSDADLLYQYLHNLECVENATTLETQYECIEAVTGEDVETSTNYNVALLKERARVANEYRADGSELQSYDYNTVLLSTGKVASTTINAYELTFSSVITNSVNYSQTPYETAIMFVEQPDGTYIIEPSQKLKNAG